MEMVLAEEPVEGGSRVCGPDRVAGHALGFETRRHGRRRLDRLLIEPRRVTAASREPVGPDRGEEAVRRPLDADEPRQRAQAGRDEVGPAHPRAGGDERVRQLRVGVGQLGLEPGPLVRLGPRVDVVQAIREVAA